MKKISKPSIKKVLLFCFLVIAILWALSFYKDNSPSADSSEVYSDIIVGDTLKTNYKKASIDQDDIISGGPGKDGIPAINKPKFTSIDEASVSDNVLGVLVVNEGIKKFYPYSILTWHEIVNDSISNMHYAVTFCPLCGSAIVYDRELDGGIVTFGVSGLLYESNLLMYDSKNETLWSQALGKAVVGDSTGTELKRLSMDVLTFSEVKKFHPGAIVLSEETGFERDYKENPYDGYEESDKLYFGVSAGDTRLPKKTIIYSFEHNKVFYALQIDSLKERDIKETKNKRGDIFTIKKENSLVTVSSNGAKINGYYEMWFSWATHRKKDGQLLSI